MKKFYLLICVGFLNYAGYSQYPLTLTNYSQNFDLLGTATASVPGGNLNLLNSNLNGWYFLESGADANTTITADNGSSAPGDSYNYGVTASSLRTLGGLQSATLI